MIGEHHFNSRWWGSSVGISNNPELLTLPAAQRASLLRHYAWVELLLPLHQAVPYLREIAASGFMQVDSQLNFRIHLKRLAVRSTSAMEQLTVETAVDAPPDVSSRPFAPFVYERFLALPGVDQERVDQRIALWSEELLTASPEHCLTILYQGRPQGWFLARPDPDKGLNLTLAMSAANATVSGIYLYQKALFEYQKRGYRMGWASFSVRNSAVHNIYTSLGATFLPPTGSWFWLNTNG